LSQRIHQNNLGVTLALYRRVQNRTLRELAKELKISHATLMRIEHGQSFDADTLLKLWQWFLVKVKP
jgi:transcriptional regulator with XRE-family HTH domain